MADYAIDPRFVDLNFQQYANQTGKLLGCVPRNFSQEPLGAIRPLYGAAFPPEIIPESKWDEICDKKDAEGSWVAEHIQFIFEQIYGSCVSNCVTQSHMCKQSEQVGPDNVILLSPLSVYPHVSSGPNSGSMLSDNLRQMQKVGALPLKNAANDAKFPITWQENQSYNTQFPAGWKDTAKLLKIDESYDIDTLEELFSAILNDRLVMYARDSHCIMACKIADRGSNRKLVYVNSWGKSFGGQINARLSYGAGYDSQSKAARVASGSIAVGSIILPDWMTVPQPI